MSSQKRKTPSDALCITCWEPVDEEHDCPAEDKCPRYLVEGSLDSLWDDLEEVQITDRQIRWMIQTYLNNRDSKRARTEEEKKEEEKKERKRVAIIYMELAGEPDSSRIYVVPVGSDDEDDVLTKKDLDYLQMMNGGAPYEDNFGNDPKWIELYDWFSGPKYARATSDQKKPVLRDDEMATHMFRFVIMA